MLTRLLEGIAVLLGAVIGGVAMALVAGLGLHRDAPPSLVALSAWLLVFGPPVLAAFLSPRNKGTAFGLSSTLWAVLLFLGVPLYFPGERADALVTGLSLGLGDSSGWTRGLAERVPEPALATPDQPLAATLTETVLPPPPALDDHQIALPYEGEGRRLVVDLAIDHGTRSREIQLLLDTGATYTTLPTSMLRELGLEPKPGDPTMTLHTANGEREAKIVLLDRLWLGDLAVEGVAIATCDPCASDEVSGLLGLNVTGGYNLMIDADRREVVFTRRADFSRHLDIKPFLQVGATVRRLPGQVKVEARVTNNAPRPVSSATVSIHCGEDTWLVDVPAIDPGTTGTAERRLPIHEPCDRYQVGLQAASW